MTKGGGLKTQETLSQQIIETIADHVGIHMTPHQFRHFAATLYLEARPEDFETVEILLGHGVEQDDDRSTPARRPDAPAAPTAKTLFEQREALKFVGKGKRVRQRKSGSGG